LKKNLHILTQVSGEYMMRALCLACRVAATNRAGEGYVPPSGKEFRGQLPATIDPVTLAEKGAHVSGTLSLKALPRLAEVCRSTAGQVDVDLEFKRGEGGDVRLMLGTIRARVSLTCQRCLEGMDYELRSEPRLVLLRAGESEEELPPEVDALTVDKPIVLNTLIEDELLLVMPMIPLHDLEHCPARAFVAAGESREAAMGSKPNPFATLQRLKRDKH
jgi:uncharacterized protein